MAGRPSSMTSIMTAHASALSPISACATMTATTTAAALSCVTERGSMTACRPPGKPRNAESERVAACVDPNAGMYQGKCMMKSPCGGAVQHVKLKGGPNK